MQAKKELIIAAYEAILYHIWITKNEMVFKKARKDTKMITQQVK